MAILPDLFPRSEPVHLFPNDALVEVVSHFQYLGSIVQDDCGSELEVDSRICKASKAFQSLSRILWYQQKIKPCTKLRILNAVILPTLLNGLESTVLHEQQIQRLQSFVMCSLRIIIGVSLKYMKCNTTLRKMAKQQACQLSRIFRESHGFTDNLTFSRVGYSKSRILVVEENKFARVPYKSKIPIYTLTSSQTLLPPF